jgi:hypothetical protein
MPKKTTEPQYGWIAVRHSGYGYAEKPGFKRGLEPRGLSMKRDLNTALKLNVPVFNTYGECDDFCTEEMYPEGHTGLYPDAQGGFSSKQIDGLDIYVPVK